MTDAPISDLPALIKGMTPRLDATPLVFTTLPAGKAMPEGLEPVATVREPEGLSLVVTAEEAERHGLTAAFPCKRVTLEVRSSLDAVGFTATVTAWLGGNGIPCNVISGYHHDHLLVPEDRAIEAVELLEQLAESSG